MASSRADRRAYHQALQSMVAQTPRPQRAQPPRPQRVFPDYIYINWEGYMRAADPFWEAKRPATSCMYQAPKQSPIRRFHHPNPLAQHPVKVEKPEPLPFKVPQRKSSLQHGLRASQPIPQPTTTTTATQQQGDLVQGIQSIQLGEPVQFSGATQNENQPDKDTITVATQLGNDIEMTDHQRPRSGSRPVSASKRHTVQFGEIMEELKAYLPVVNMQSHDGPESTTVAEDQPPNKRHEGRFGSIRRRNRFSMVATPVIDSLQDGRKSSASAVVRNFGKASKGFLGKLTPGNFTGLPPTRPARVLSPLALAPKLTTIEETHQLRVAFIGDGRCGKTALIHRFTTGTFLGSQHIFNSASNPYTMQLTAPMEVDNYQATLELWDVSSHLNPIQINPLKMSFFHAVVICFDIKDEANLKSVVDKWQHEPKVFCTGAPVILLGLKSDLRPAYPTLKLRFLEEEDEPTAATVGQGDLTAREIDAAAYFECSAKTGEGVVDFFESMVRIAVNGQRQDTTPPLLLTVRFSTSIPDLLLDIPHPQRTTAAALKHLIRSRLGQPNSQRRIRFIHGGKIIPDGAVLASVLKALPPPPTSAPLSDDQNSSGPRGKGKGVDGSSRQSPNSSNNDAAAPAPRGFDRLLTAGFTPAEVNQLRLQFRSIQEARHTADTMPSPDGLRGMEDAGMFIGFIWPLGAVGWLVRDEEKISKRMRVFVYFGFVLSLLIGTVRNMG
ncbi:hypothetical protein VPNG_09425 [Cytospora leucostoma]|uniref:Ubiquitin-like domain-containing protein n=1 Tax=Cytospora leucostoma TaxID=1230097 RepID=A0A423VQ18_9PEZI|nr:hypothetical protein VPNG_09425 [Cytospora leucostoma]